MTGEAWRRHFETYVARRRAVGFGMRQEAHLLQLKKRALRKLDPLGQRTWRFKADSSADLPREPLIMESAGHPQPRPPPSSPSAACHNAELVMMRFIPISE